jgi:hypothetical protein
MMKEDFTNSQTTETCWDDGHTLDGRTLRSSVMDKREAFWWLENLLPDCIRGEAEFFLDGEPIYMTDPFELDRSLEVNFTKHKG